MLIILVYAYIKCILKSSLVLLRNLVYINSRRLAKCRRHIFCIHTTLLSYKMFTLLSYIPPHVCVCCICVKPRACTKTNKIQNAHAKIKLCIKFGVKIKTFSYTTLLYDDGGFFFFWINKQNAYALAGWMVNVYVGNSIRNKAHIFQTECLYKINTHKELNFY